MAAPDLPGADHAQVHHPHRRHQYDKALVPFVKHVVEDGRLVTGQNPNSAKGVAERVVALLRAG